MIITGSCPDCRREFEWEAEEAGQPIECPHCHRQVRMYLAPAMQPPDPDLRTWRERMVAHPAALNVAIIAVLLGILLIGLRSSSMPGRDTNAADRSGTPEISDPAEHSRPPPGRLCPPQAKVRYQGLYLFVKNEEAETWKSVALMLNDRYTCYIPSIKAGETVQIPLQTFADGERRFDPMALKPLSITVKLDGEFYQAAFTGPENAELPDWMKSDEERTRDALQKALQPLR